MRISLAAFSDRGEALAERLTGQLKREGEQAQYARCGRELGVAEWTAKHFAADDALVVIGAAGIAVRAVAPHVKSKLTDPAVVVIDETGRYVIPILSGHLGGANALASRLAGTLGAEAVITTATDVKGVFAIDDWARRMNCAVANTARIRQVSGALLAGRHVTVKSDFEISGRAPEGILVENRGAGTRGSAVDLTGGSADRSAEYEDAQASCRITIRGGECPDALCIIPRIVCAGVGAKRGTSCDDIERAVLYAFSKADISPKALCAVASIDLKADEEGLLAYAEQRKVPFLTYTAEELLEVPGEFSASRFVASVTGVDNVCERAAVLAAGRESSADGLICTKTITGGVTVALAVRKTRLDWETSSLLCSSRTIPLRES